MMGHLARQNAQLWETINTLTKGPYIRDGNPRAAAEDNQRRDR
jgi:hypothetical protein